MIIKELFARLGLDVDKGGFSAGEVAIAGVKTGLVAMTGIAVAAGTALAAMVHNVVEAAGHLNDTAAAVNLDTTALQELGYAFQLGGVGLEEFAGGVQILSRRVADAASGGEEAAKAFSSIGVTLKDQNGKLKATDALIGDIAEAFKNMPDGPKKTAAAMDIFGRSGARFLSTLKEGRDGIAGLRAEAQELGFIMDEQTVKAGDDLGDNLDRIKAILIGIQGSIAGPLIGQLNALVDEFKEWHKANKVIIAQRLDQIVKFLSASIKVLVAVLKALWYVLGLVIDHWQLLAVLLASGVLTAVTLNAAAIAALALNYLRAGAAAALAGARAAAAWIAAAAGPLAITALFATIILLVDEFITALEGGETLIGNLYPKWQEFIEEFSHGGSDEDPWWLKSLRGLVNLVLHFDAYWGVFTDAAKDTFNELGRWIEQTVKTWVGYIVNPLVNAVDTVKKSFTQTIPNAFTSVFRFGGGSTPAASVANSPSTGSRVLNQKVENNIQLTQQPGQSATDLVGELDRKLEARQQTLLEETYSAFGG